MCVFVCLHAGIRFSIFLYMCRYVYMCLYICDIEGACVNECDECIVKHVSIITTDDCF